MASARSRACLALISNFVIPCSGEPAQRTDLSGDQHGVCRGGGWSPEPRPFQMIGSAPHPVRFVYDGGTSNLLTKWSPATCSLPTSFTSSFASSVTREARDYRHPSRSGTARYLHGQ